MCVEAVCIRIFGETWEARAAVDILGNIMTAVEVYSIGGAD